MAVLVNVGCGEVAHPQWLNFDVEPRLPFVQRLDVRHGVPVAPGSADCVYSSHLLEHLTELEADTFLADMYRVLAPGGTIRVVVPDLEQICRIYLNELEAQAGGGASSDFAYRFSLLELFDQCERDHSGGAMMAAYRSARGADAEYVLRRHGAEAAPHLPDAPQRITTASTVVRPREPLWRRLRWRALTACVRLLGGSDAAQWLQIGRFRQSGEIHRVMYDRYSLAAALRRNGFVDPQPVAADQSSVAGFARYELDTRDGRVRKPDSLFFEARKPLAAST